MRGTSPFLQIFLKHIYVRFLSESVRPAYLRSLRDNHNSIYHDTRFAEDIEVSAEKERVARAKWVKTLLKAQATKIQVASAAGPAGASGSSAAAGSSASASSGLGVPPTVDGALRWPKQSGVTLAWAQSLLPQVSGCRISKDSNRHFRWQVCYPRTEAPNSKSCGFGRDAAENDGVVRSALVQCIHWAWQQHVDLGGEPVPFRL